MPHSEDYLDSLLDSIDENKNSSKNKSGRKDSSDNLSESQYLREFEDDIFSDMDIGGGDDFLKDFERDIGFEVNEGSRDLSKSNNSKAIAKSGDKKVDDLLSGMLDEMGESDTYDDIDDTMSGVLDGSISQGEDEILDNLADILNGEDETESAPPSDNLTDIADEGDDALSDIPDLGEEGSSGEDDGDTGADFEDTPDAGDDGIMSDIEGEEPAETPEDTEPDVSEDDDALSDIPEDDVPEAEGDGEPVSEEEVLDIGNLLDSIDGEGNLTEAEMEKPAGQLDDEAARIDRENAENAPEGEGEPAEEEKQGFLQKLLGKLFKKKKGDGEEEAEAEGEAEAAEVMAAVEGVETEDGEALDPKAAKKAEKERKKKEKEEAKKKAKAEKEKAAKEKTPKEKKPKKKKEKDNSPKIPIIVIIPFVLLSVSIFVLWTVLKDNISYSTTTKEAQSLFDKGEYAASYELLDGITLNEEDALLGQRASLMAMLEYRISAYNVYVNDDHFTHVFPLDQLVMGVVYYEDHKEEAAGIAIKDSFDNLGRQLTELLAGYGLTPEDAMELMDIRDREEYTRSLYAILEEGGFWSPPTKGEDGEALSQSAEEEAMSESGDMEEMQEAEALEDDNAQMGDEVENTGE